MNGIYPKVLIVGQYFNTSSGGGITMSNLFAGWDKESLAVAAENINNANFEICNKYYQLGSLESKSQFPFNLNKLGQYRKSGLLSKNEQAVPSFAFHYSKKKSYKNLYDNFLSFTGLCHYRHRYKISNEFLTWVKEFSPDIIYSQLSSLDRILFIRDLHEKLQIPVAIHIMDDWPSTISQKGILKSYWHKIIDREFRNLLSASRVLMGISESMNKEYKKRYGYNFIPFHNPIDIPFWGAFSKKNYRLKNTFVILYAGRIGTGIQNCFFEIAEAINSLILKGLKIELHIQPTNFNGILNDLLKFTFVKINKAVEYKELPKIFAAADLLLLPNDFGKKSISFLRYSMPTKASEYMISGTPILVYSSIETAVTKHALKHNWAYVVAEKDKKKLELAICKIYKEQELRSKLGNIARQYAINNYDSNKIKYQFKMLLS